MKVGDYVRTVKGNIYKLKEEDLMFEMTKQNCKISSSRIIDLIEVGDYVNGYMVENIGAGLNGDVIEIATGTNYFQSPSLYEDDIKSIVTKEQFESIEYKIERQV